MTATADSMEDYRTDGYPQGRHCHVTGTTGHRPVFAGRAGRGDGFSVRTDCPGPRQHDAGIRRHRTRQVLDNLQAVAEAAGGGLDALARISIYLTDLDDFGTVNEIMAERFSTPYPARSTIQVAGLPKGAAVEIDAIMVL